MHSPALGLKKNKKKTAQSHHDLQNNKTKTHEREHRVCCRSWVMPALSEQGCLSRFKCEWAAPSAALACNLYIAHCSRMHCVDAILLTSHLSTHATVHTCHAQQRWMIAAAVHCADDLSSPSCIRGLKTKTPWLLPLTTMTVTCK